MTQPAMFSWLRRGRVWRFGDDIGVDGDLMPLSFAIKRETDRSVLRNHIFAGVDPDIARRIEPGDVIIAGRRFAQGNPHIQGLLGLAGAGVGLIARSIPSGSYRNVVNAGLPFLLDPENRLAEAETGEAISVDFRSGDILLEASGRRLGLVPPEPFLQDIIAMGGWEKHFAGRLSRRKMEGVHDVVRAGF